MKKGILVIGSLNMDMSVSLDKIPEVGETVLGNGLSYREGGKGANQACAAGKLLAEVRMLGCIGQDEFGKRQRESLEESGVAAEYLKESLSQPTGTAIIYVDVRGDNNIVVIPGANNQCDAEYLSAQHELFEWCDYVLLQMEIPHDAVEFAVIKAKEMGKTVILNPAPAPETLSEHILQAVDYLTPNETELMKLSGVKGDSIEEMKKGASILRERGVKQVLVTLGDRGALLVKEGETRIYPAQKVKAVDTTAAGDCFNGAFVTALAEGKSEEEAILFANAASAIAVTRKGAQESLPMREELDSGGVKE